MTVTPRMVQITGEKQQEPVNLEVWGQEYDFNEELIVFKKQLTVQRRSYHKNGADQRAI